MPLSKCSIKDISYLPSVLHGYLLSLSFRVAQFTSTVSGDEVTASPQNSPNYIIIGASAAGGVLLLVIIAVVIRKCLCKARTSSAKQPRNIARVNDCLEGEFELSSITGNI